MNDKDIVDLKQNKDKSLNLIDIKNIQLFKVLRAITIIGIPVLIVNTYFAIYHGTIQVAIYNAIILLPSVFIFLLFKRIGFKLKFVILLFSFYFLAAFNFSIGGTSGAGIILLLGIVSLSTIYMDIKAGYRSIIISTLLLLIFAYLFTNEIISLVIDTNITQRSVISWVVATMVFILIAYVIVLNFGIIQRFLIQKIEIAKQREEELKTLNTRLEKEIEKKELIQKELVIAKEKAERSNKLKTDFIHNMTHEVRTPLNGIYGFSQLLKRDNVDDSKRIKYAEIIMNSSEQLQKIIEDILEISTLETKNSNIILKEININELLEELYEIFSVKKGNKDTRIILKQPEKSLIVNSDESKLIKILSNLIENAIKFTKQGFVEFGYYSDNNTVTFFVKDSGIGISDENKTKIFERFTQESQETAVNYGGLGLGLAIAKENTILLGGNIKVSSVKGKGTEFFVIFPSKQQNP